MLQDAVDQIVQLDTQMVELRRVMDATPQTYNNLLEESIALSTELGNKVNSVQDALGSWARQGFDPETLIDLTSTATIADNISNIEGTEEAVSILTAAMQAYNIEASQSISIIDRLNEVD